MNDYHCKTINHTIDATVALPGSKSITNRALIAAALADGDSILSGVLLAEDTRLMIDALRQLGVAVTIDESECLAEVSGCRGHLPASDADLFCGNSGTTIRFCAALCATAHGQFRLDGIERMRERPIGGLVEALRALGSRIEYENREEHPPLIVHATALSGGTASFNNPASSQWISAVLLAAPYAGGDVMIDVRGDIPSIPYLKMTTQVMSQFGVNILEQYEDRRVRFIVEAPQRYGPTNIPIEPDASAATYFWAAAAIAGGRVCIEGIGTNSIQGDAKFPDVLEKMGCDVKREPNRTTVALTAGKSTLRGVDVDMNDMPDAAMTLAVVALFAEGTTTIRNVANLRVKETDRLTALSTELRKLGATVDELPDGLQITPAAASSSPTEIVTYNDHRMAMAFALAGLRCPELTIKGSDCVAKTFPDFFSYFERACEPIV
jgi:3-phosphoshikimate 1-carboxyvinyltransferase